jgi:hypothetical protein
MKRRTKEVLFGFTLIILCSIGFFLLLTSCENEITSPAEEGISGNYKSVAYQEGYETFENVSLELHQRSETVTGRFIDGGRKFTLQGTNINNHVYLEFSNGKLDMWIDVKGTYYPLAGSCLYDDDVRAIRFQLDNHNQGKIQ